jgi:DNA-binding IclR family transcriptional regulator
MAASWTIQSLARGLELLDLIATQPTGATMKWLSAVSGIPLSTCYHLVNTLIAAGYVEKDRASQAYQISYKIGYLHNQWHQGRQVPEALTRLANQAMADLHETPYLAKWEADAVVIQYIAEGNQAVKVRSLYVGYREHPFLHALGKAVLAQLDAGPLRDYYLSHRPERRSPYSKVAWEEVQAELVLTRDRGYSLDIEEWETGICCIGVPVVQYDGTVWGSLAISMPKSRYRPGDRRVIAYLQDKGRMMSESLGYTPVGVREARRATGVGSRSAGRAG